MQSVKKNKGLTHGSYNVYKNKNIADVCGLVTISMERFLLFYLKDLWILCNQ